MGRYFSKVWWLGGKGNIRRFGLDILRKVVDLR
jgi:hypothetical protein